MFGIGMTELMVVFVVGLVVLGPKRLPSLARSLGRTLAEFRHASNDLRRDFMDVTNSIDLDGPPRSDESDGGEEKVPPSDAAPAPAENAANDSRKDEGPEPTGG